jgi:hypothetical protein
VETSLRLHGAAETDDCRPRAACNAIRHGRQHCGCGAGLGLAPAAGWAVLQSQLSLIFVLVPPSAAGGSGRLWQFLNDRQSRCHSDALEHIRLLRHRL